MTADCHWDESSVTRMRGEENARLMADCQLNLVQSQRRSHIPSSAVDAIPDWLTLIDRYKRSMYSRLMARCQWGASIKW